MYTIYKSRKQSDLTLIETVMAHGHKGGTVAWFRFPLEGTKYYLLILPCLRSGTKAKRRTKRSVLTPGSHCLTCCMRDTAGS